MRWLFPVLAVFLLLADIRDAHAQSTYESARRELTERIESGGLSDDALATAYLQRGYLWMRSNKAEEAMADFDSAIAAAPKRADAYQLRAQLWFAVGRSEQAIDDASQAIALAQPDDPQPYLFRAEIWTQTRDFAKAVADYDAALGRDSTEWEGRVKRGIALAELGDNDRALADLDKAIETDPKSLGTKKHRECIRTQAQTTPNCKTKERPISTEYLMHRAYRSRGVILFNQGQYQRAAADLDRAGRTDDARLYLGLARLALGDCRKGYGNLQQADESMPLEETLAKHRDFILKTTCADYVFD